MQAAMKLTSLIMAVTVTLFAPASPPRCIGDLTTAESGARASFPAPTVHPDHGPTGTSVSIRGGAFPPATRLTVAAVYAENDCAIEGLGDQYLGSTIVDGRGRYAITIPWPATFDPVLGRNKAETKALPRGRYYVFALPCETRAACSFTAGTEPGGPFVLGAARAFPEAVIARGSPAPLIASAAAIVLILGVVVIRRRAR
jgi:hypothetical protein